VNLILSLWLKLWPCSPHNKIPASRRLLLKSG
jgi:hypothetical protein